jgi:hypothetical protein
VLNNRLVNSRDVVEEGMFLHATLSAKPGRANDVIDIVTRLKPAMEQQGWRLAAAWLAVTGRRGQVIDLWEVDDANSVTDALQRAAQHPKAAAMLSRLGECLDREELRLVEELPYGPTSSPGGAELTYMQATLKLRYGTHTQFAAALARMVPALEREGWRLLGAYRPLVGEFTEVIDVWELPSADAVRRGLAAAKQEQGFLEAALDVAACIEVEELQLLEKAPYSP